LIILKSRKEIERMRESCKIVAEILGLLKSLVLPGVTTERLDAFAEAETIKRKARPAFKGYSGYPFTLCCSINEQVVHGMPSKRELVEGDILSIDFGVLYNGFYGDAALTVPVGKVSKKAAELIEATEQSLFAAINKACRILGGPGLCRTRYR
jgi:methionyl aminopeptidase